MGSVLSGWACELQRFGRGQPAACGSEEAAGYHSAAVGSIWLTDDAEQRDRWRGGRSCAGGTAAPCLVTRMPAGGSISIHSLFAIGTSRTVASRWRPALKHAGWLRAILDAAHCKPATRIHGAGRLARTSQHTTPARHTSTLGLLAPTPATQLHTPASWWHAPTPACQTSNSPSRARRLPARLRRSSHRP